MSIIRSSANPLRQSQHKKTYIIENIDNTARFDTSVSTKSFEQFVKSPSSSELTPRPCNSSIRLVNNESVINEDSSMTHASDVYNIPWDFKNKLLQQQQQLKVQPTSPPQPPSIPPPPLPITPVPKLDEQKHKTKSSHIQQQQQEYCAPWDLKLQEERLKQLTITTNTPSSTLNTSNNASKSQPSPKPTLSSSVNAVSNNEYSPPWDQKQNIIIKQIKDQQNSFVAPSQPIKVKLSCSPSSSTSSLSSVASACSPSQQQQHKVFVHSPKPAAAPTELHQQKFNSWGSNCSSNKSIETQQQAVIVQQQQTIFEDTKPMIKPRKSFRQENNNLLISATPQTVLLLPAQSTVATPIVQIPVTITATSGGQLQIVNKTTTIIPQAPPLPSTPAYMVLLERQNWYHGKITRKQAEILLQDKPIGSYLVRQSESGNQDDFSLSLVSGSGCVHMRICLKNGEFILGQCSQPFTSIIKMIEHYSKIEVPIKGAQHVKLVKPINV